MENEKGLDQFSAAYQEDFAYALDNDLILNWYPNRIMMRTQGSSLLELGVGHGVSSYKFGQKMQRHLILDGSEEIVKQFRSNFPECDSEVQITYFESFESEEKFDNIVMGFVLEHVDDPRLILERYKKFLKPGGKIYATVPNAESLHRRLGNHGGFLDDLFTLGEGDKQLGHQQLFSVQSLTDLAADLGLAVSHKEGLLLKPFTTAQILKLELNRKVLDGLMEEGVPYPELCCAFLLELEEARS